MKRQKKYNIIIFTSLFLAIILLLLAGRSYLTGKDAEIQTEVDNTSEEKINREDTEITKEPENMVDVDKTAIVKKYLDSLEDQIQKSKIITHKMINSWGDYSVGDIIYQRELDTDYYEYKVNIVIPESDAKLPCSKNEELSNEEITVITLYFDIINSEKSNGYIVKNIDLIGE